MISKMLLTACAIAVTAIPGLAQTPISKVIDDLHSTDPVTRKAGEQSMLAVFQQEFPNIEQETHVICAALTDNVVIH